MAVKLLGMNLGGRAPGVYKAGPAIHAAHVGKAHVSHQAHQPVDRHGVAERPAGMGDGKRSFTVFDNVKNRLVERRQRIPHLEQDIAGLFHLVHSAGMHLRGSAEFHVRVVPD